MAKERDFKIIRVTQTVDYIVEERGTPIEAIIQEWFYDPRYPLDGHHAYRNGSQVGNSIRILGLKVLTPQELDEMFEERMGKKKELEVNAKG